MASPAVLRPMIASSSRLTLLHPCHLPKRILRSPLALRYASSVAQQRPVESAAFADVHAPPYISPVDKVKANTLGKVDVMLDKGKGKAVDELGHVEGSDLGTKVQTTEPAPKRRSIRASKSAITMTPAAIQHLKDLLSSPTEPKLLRIGVKTRGCAGMAYHLDYIAPTEIPRFDEVVEQDGVKILIDSKALFSIIGSRMDWRDNRLSAGFVFDNPNVVDTCGCGESFNIQ